MFDRLSETKFENLICSEKHPSPNDVMQRLFFLSFLHQCRADDTTTLRTGNNGVETREQRGRENILGSVYNATYFLQVLQFLVQSGHINPLFDARSNLEFPLNSSKFLNGRINQLIQTSVVTNNPI